MALFPRVPVCPALSRAGHGRGTSRQNAASKPNLDSRQHETSVTPTGIQLSELSKVELPSDQGLCPHLSDTIELFKMLVKGAPDQVKKLSFVKPNYVSPFQKLILLESCL